MDILAIKKCDNNWNCIHCEVQVGIGPIGYISKLTEELKIIKNVKSPVAL